MVLTDLKLPEFFIRVIGSYLLTFNKLLTDFFPF